MGIKVPFNGGGECSGVIVHSPNPDYLGKKVSFSAL